MRKIKFRAKRKDMNRWVEGQYFMTPLSDENSESSPDDGWFFLRGEPRHCIARDGVAFVIDEQTLGEYTGFDDIHGKEIYEGDIVLLNRYPMRVEDGYVGIVAFEQGTFILIRWTRKDTDVSGISHGIADPLDDFSEDGMTVVGNIIDNQDLLREPYSIEN